MPPPHLTETSLVGTVIESTREPGVRFVLERSVGEGGMGTAFLASRESASGSSPVVVKVMNPDFAAGEIAPDVVARKEAVALERLNAQVPPSPFVVRFVDAGAASLGHRDPVPWTAIEYVHGGVEGTTLEDRVTYSVHKTGYAFDSARASHAIRCLGTGLSTIHEAGVIHRDLTPGNVLCCGFGTREIFKIADFGVARAAGLQLTFDGRCLGTVGYSAPEAAGASAGPATDVFALAAVIYYILTGQHYFPAESPVEALQLIIAPARPSIADHPTLAPDLARRAETCAAIDEALARATMLDAKARFATPNELASEVMAHLGEELAPRSSRQLLSAVQSSRQHFATSHRFTLRSRPQDDFVVRRAAWDADGHALALLEPGGRFWNGDAWLDAAPLLAEVSGDLRFVLRERAGGWLLVGDGLCPVDARGVGDPLRVADSAGAFSMAGGTLDDVLLVYGLDAREKPTLWPVVGRRFLPALAFDDALGVAEVTVVEPLDDAEFLVAGTRVNGRGFAVRVAPLKWVVSELETGDLPGFSCGSGAVERTTVLVAGRQGVVLRVKGEQLSVSEVPGQPDLMACAVDELGREWVAAPGSLWTRDPDEDDTWQPSWRDAHCHTPWISLIAQPGQVLAMMADGAIVEGRSTS